MSPCGFSLKTGSGCSLLFRVWMACMRDECGSVWRLLEWVKVLLCLCERVCTSFKKKPTQWSYLIWSEFGSALTGDDRKPAREPSWRWSAGTSLTPGPPRFMLWSEVMNWSDILVLGEFGFISNFTVDDEYRGDSDLTTAERQPGALDGCTLLLWCAAVY